MKKILFLMLASLLGTQHINAQDNTAEYGIFNHLGAAVSVGTDGIGFDVASPLTNYVAFRAGVSFWPKIKFSHNFRINDNNPLITDNVDVEAKSNIFNCKLLADIYPSKHDGFHFTIGAFVGNDDVVNATNTSMFITDPSKYGKLGLKLGDYRVTTDEKGYAHADVKVNSFKPYLGIGFGRAIPQKNRVSVACDLGVQFWGKPGLGAKTKDDWGDESYHKFKSSELDEYDDPDLKDGLEIAEKIVVFPVISIRISGRIF